jgi:anti-anti-sigma factor
MPNHASQPVRSWELRIGSETLAGVAVLRVAGRISGRTAPLLAQAIGAGPAADHPLILDLTAVDYISSAGFAVLHAAASSRVVVVCGLSDPLATTFGLAEHPPQLIREPALPNALERVTRHP